MNFVFISPNFPVRYYKWAEALKDHGITVLGIGDSPLYDVHPRLLHALTEYYFVKDLSNIEDLKKACQYFQDKYGKIDYIESDNEWWLYNDSVLRKAFNVTTGFYPEDMEKIKAKSAMKECFINAGAITVASCIQGKDADEKFGRFLEFTRKLCNNHEIALNQPVYESERETGDRNRALAYYLKASGILEGDVEECLDFYFRMCSVDVTAHDIAYMSLVLANHGIDPLDGEELIEPQYAKAIRALMLTCGMYDGSGEFAMTVGFPAKSGVGGGIAVPLVDRMGIGVFGPALDEKGNSAGGIKILEYLSNKMNISLF